MRLLLTGGGTAGHINPALAIAETVRRNDPTAVIEFVGIENGKEADLIPREGYRLHYVQSMGIRRSLSLSNVKAIWMALTSPKSPQTQKILDDFQPDIVIGTGGYASWPIMKAAADRGIPTAVHESNALPGMTVKRLLRHVDRVWINFPQTAERLHNNPKVCCVGNPLRGGFGACSKAEARRRLGIPEDRFFLLSFGGSLGAENVNLAAIELMKSISSVQKKLLHHHAAGKRDYEHTRAIFTQEGLGEGDGCVLTDYIYDMPLQMAAADAVISRAGAMTLSELAWMKKACILIPSPNVADNHQYINAKTLADAGAALLVEERSLASGALTDAVQRLLVDPALAKEMEARIAMFADRDANRRIWEEICRLIGRSATGEKKKDTIQEGARV